MDTNFLHVLMLVPLLASCAEIPLRAHVRKTAADDVGLVELGALTPPLILDIRYATANNFTGRVVYPSARAFLRRDAACALLRVNAALRVRGLQLKVFDAYRPVSVQKILWNVMPDERYVADPKIGSIHNRGMAVDVTLVDLRGGEIPMPTGYDEFSEKAYRDYRKLPAAALRNRAILRAAMEAEGFNGIPTEWWHYDFHGWGHCKVLDVPIPE